MDIENSNNTNTFGPNQDDGLLNLPELMDNYNVPAAACAVVNGGKLLWSQQHGIVESGKDCLVGADTRFHACSMSKFVTALTALTLVEEGVINLDEPVNNKLSSWQLPHRDASLEKPVTLRHLLCHQAGISDHPASFGVYRAGDTIPTLLDVLDGHTPYNPKPVVAEGYPESEFIYSDAGYCVIEQLLVDLTDLPFPDIVRKRVFEPLQLSASDFLSPVQIRDNQQLAAGHNQHGDVVEGTRVYYPYMAAAGLWSTASDLSQLIIELHQRLHGKGRLPISVELVQQMLTPQGCVPWAGLGGFLGGENNPQQRMFSQGWGVGFQCMLVAYPYLGAGVIAMTNMDPGCHQDKAFCGELIRKAERLYGWKGEHDPGKA